ncbi:MAG: peptidoglycan DD-metalloendopeptidase family protein [Chitinophagaceae bacterium]|nr:peptidoglycan DD-metalloendopeptidase family protein [Chitinophagaceae bacterium]
MRVLLILFLTIIITLPSTAQNRSELEKQRSEIQREIEEVKQSLSQTKKNRKESLGQLALLQKKLRLREAAISNINQQINFIQGNISQSRNEISKLKKELDTLKIQYEKSVVYAYKNRSNYDFLNFIFSAANFNDALKRVEYLKSYRSYREQQATNIKSTQSLLQNKISGLELTRREQSEVLTRQQKEKLVLVEEKKEKDVVVSKLKSREKELSKELSSKQKADNKIRASIKAAIDREIRLARQKALEEENRKKAENPDVAKPVTSTKKDDIARKRSVFDDVPGGEIISDNFEKNRGKLPWPVDKGHIKIGYGTYSIPETKLKGNNPGLTLETETGSSVKAIFDGDVISVFDVDGESNVIVRHGKYFTTYGRLSSTSVSKGQKVKTGQVVGRASSNEDGNGEIEFLLMEETRKLDPALWIRRR